MASSRRGLPEINAGSMADIAFLLLIFFLVTTTMDVDSGIARKLPPMENQQENPPKFHQRNIYQVFINICCFVTFDIKCHIFFFVKKFRSS